jgi:uncharacterized protein
VNGKLLFDGGKKTWVLIYETVDEVLAGLQRFAREHGPRSAHFTAIGAFREVVLAYFDWPTKAYQDIPVNEQAEVLIRAGDIAWNKHGEPAVRAHAVVGRQDGSTRGGHLKSAHVRPTLGLVLTEYARHLERKPDAESGLALIRV